MLPPRTIKKYNKQIMSDQGCPTVVPFSQNAFFHAFSQWSVFSYHSLSACVDPVWCKIVHSIAVVLIYTYLVSISKPYFIKLVPPQKPHLLRAAHTYITYINPRVAGFCPGGTV